MDNKSGDRERPRLAKRARPRPARRPAKYPILSTILFGVCCLAALVTMCRMSFGTPVLTAPAPATSR